MKKGRCFLNSILLLLMLLLSTQAWAGPVVLPTDISEAPAGSVMLGIRGKYLVDTQAALDRINAIRYEACTEGVQNPASSSKAPLTLDDYVPIKWSADLEYIARIRAAEAALTKNHVRTNGNRCLALASPNGEKSWSEVIAWNRSQSVIMGIEQWYEEKSNWVNQRTRAATGHYTAMINPQNLFVGLGTFCSSIPQYYNTTAGEFSRKPLRNETRGMAVNDCLQMLEVKSLYLTGSYEVIKVDKNAVTTQGSHTELALTTGVTFVDYGGDALTTKGLVIPDATWSTSDPSIATVTQDGIATSVKCGTAKITAISSTGITSTMDFTVEHTLETDPAVSPTCTKPGVTAGSHCKFCGTVVVEKKEVPAKGHEFGRWTVIKKATTLEAGIRQRTCRNAGCGEVETEEIAKRTKPGSTTGTTSPVPTKKQTITTSFVSTIKNATLRKKNVNVKLNAVTSGSGTLSYKVEKCPAGMQNYVKVTKKGVVKFKKGAKKGTYKISIMATAHDTYKEAKKIVKIKIK